MFKSRYSKILVIVLFSIGSLKSQTIDSLKTLLHAAQGAKSNILIKYKISDLYRNYNIDSSLWYAQQGLLLAQINRLDSSIIAGLHRVGYSYLGKEEFAKARDYFSSSLSYLSKIKQATFNKGHIYDDIARTFLSEEQFDSARSYSMKAYKIHLENHDSIHQANTLGQIAVLNLINGQLDSALNKSFEAKNILESMRVKDHDDLGSLYQNISIIYFRMWELISIDINTPYDDSARSYTLKAMEQYKIIDKKEGIAGCYNMLGNLEKNILFPDVTVYDLQAKVNYYEEALRIKYLIGKSHPIIISLMNLGGALAELGEFTHNIQHKDNGLVSLHKALSLAKQEFPENIVLQAEININIGDAIRYAYQQPLKAKEYYLQAIKLAKSKNQVKLLSSTYNHLAYLFTEINKYDSAFYYYVESTVIDDSIFNEEKQLYITQLQERYQHELNKREIAELLVSNERQKQQLSRNRIQNSIQVALIAVISIILFLLYFQNRHTARVKNRMKLSLIDYRSILERYRNFYNSIIDPGNNAKNATLVEIDQNIHNSFLEHQSELDKLFTYVELNASKIDDHHNRRDIRSLRFIWKEIKSYILRIQSTFNVFNSQLINTIQSRRINYSEIIDFMTAVDKKLKIQLVIDKTNIIKRKVIILITIQIIVSLIIILLAMMFSWQAVELFVYIQSSIFWILELGLLFQFDKHSKTMMDDV